MIYPLFHALKRDFQYFTCIRNGQKRRGMCHCFPMELGRKIFLLVVQWPQMQNVINYSERLGEKSVFWTSLL